MPPGEQRNKLETNKNQSYTTQSTVATVRYISKHSEYYIYRRLYK
jgi:hypothetical protein